MKSSKVYFLLLTADLGQTDSEECMYILALSIHASDYTIDTV